MRRFAFSLALATVLAGPAVAQERTPSQRQTLVLLAYVLGEAHALDQSCQGLSASRWRRRMQRVLQVEEPDAAFRGRLETSFNEGLEYRRAQHPACDAAARAAIDETARRGAELSRGLVDAAAASEAAVAGSGELR